MSVAAGVVWLDGEVFPAGEARVSAIDRGLLYGDGVFETLRVYRGVPFRAGAHIERLCAGARELHIALPASPGDLMDALGQAVEACGEPEAYLRMTLTRGVGGLPSELDRCVKPTVIVQARPFGGYPAEAYERGYRACLSPIRRNETSPLSRIKSLNYLDSVLARARALADGYDEALMANTQGLLAEGSASNLFLVTGAGVVTPRVPDGCLPGIVRAVVMELRPVTQGSVTAEALEQAQEAFLTNSLMEIMPLVEVDGKAIGAGQPGPVTEQLRAEYAKLVAGECGG